jgi:phosphotransferase system  glucose/maltose/N-acetylglucosamine-specific IIC component
MDTTFFVGIFIGAIVSIITSFYANLYTDQFREFLSRRRQVRLSSKKANELKTYAFVKSLKLGDPIALLELQGRRSQTIMLMLLAVFGITLAVLFIVAPTTDHKSPSISHAVVSIVLVSFSLSSLIVALANDLSVGSSIKKAKQFDQYESDIRTKWGADAI